MGKKILEIKIREKKIMELIIHEKNDSGAKNSRKKILEPTIHEEIIL